MARLRPAALRGRSSSGRAQRVHELYLLVDDVDALVKGLAARGLECDAPRHLDWGRLTAVPLPGGGRLGVYQPLHEVVAGS